MWTTYLADWRSAIARGQQLTGVTWEFNEMGPSSREVLEAIFSGSRFGIVPGRRSEGGQQQVVAVDPQAVPRSLTSEDKEILTYVVERVAHHDDSGLVRLVYSTFPILCTPRFSKLSLPELAARYSVEGAALTEQ
jgi:hypothetical protein